jgi:outer membrane protein TolC
MRNLFSRRFRAWCQKSICLALIASTLTGCAADRTLSYLGGAKEMQYYEDAATRIEYPNTETTPNPSVSPSQQTRDLTHQSHEQIWEMPLAEAIQLALSNNKIIRSRNDFLNGGTLYSSPDNVPSVFDPAIDESGVLFGGRGVESALAQFDTQWTTQMAWGGNQTVSNNPFASNGLPVGSVFQQDTANFSSGLQKNFAYGAQGTITQNVNYSQNDAPRLFPSAYDGNLVFAYTQPLWAGAGAEFTRIAGPVSGNISGLSGVNQGVLIARINNDITLVDFEINVRNMLRDVEDTYWDLYLAYRRYDSVIAARNSNLQTWRDEQTKLAIGAGNPADEAQAREAYFNARAESENALGGTEGTLGIYALELQLRRLCGLPSNDGRIIRPKDEPTTAQFVPQWQSCLADGLARREELRRQKWNIKSLELQLIASQNVANPRFDFVSSYQLNGFGNDLIASNTGTSGPNAFQGFYGSQFRGQQSGYGLGFQFSMPIGLRNAKSQVRNVELRLAKAQEVMSVQEQEVCHELTNAFQNLRWRYQTSQTNFNRRRAAERQVQTRYEEYKAGTKTLDLLLRAQSALAVAEIAYYTSLVGYNKAITDLNVRKGTLLENNNVHLAEGAWTPEAYKDAIRRAWARTYAFDAPSADPVHHEPEPVTATGYYSEALQSDPQQVLPMSEPVGADVPPPASIPPEASPKPLERAPDTPDLQPSAKRLPLRGWPQKRPVTNRTTPPKILQTSAVESAE